MQKKAAKTPSGGRPPMTESMGRLPRVPDYVLVHALYGLFILSLGSMPIMAVVGFVLIYILNSRGLKSGPAYSHCLWVLRGALATIAALVVFGLFGAGFYQVHPVAGGVLFLPAVIVIIWFVIRIVRGWLTLVDGKAIAKPKSWGF